MKKNQKKLAINNQEEEDFEVLPYILKMQLQMQTTKTAAKKNDGFETAVKAKKPYNLISTNQPSSNFKIKS